MRQKPPVEVFDAPTDVSGIYPASRARRQRDLGAALIRDAGISSRMANLLNFRMADNPFRVAS